MQVEAEHLAHFQPAVLALARHQEHRGRERIGFAQLAVSGEYGKTQRQTRLSHADFTRLGELLLLQPHR